MFLPLNFLQLDCSIKFSISKTFSKSIGKTSYCLEVSKEVTRRFLGLIPYVATQPITTIFLGFRGDEDFKMRIATADDGREVIHMSDVAHVVAHIIQEGCYPFGFIGIKNNTPETIERINNLKND